MPQPRQVLGRGLSALIPQSSTSLAARDYIQCPLDQIQIAGDQPRHRFDEQRLAELAASIRDKGVLQPIVVARQGHGYRLIAGERRVRASRMAGLTSIPAVVRDVATVEAFELALIENIQREDLDPIEEAEAYRRLQETAHCSQEELARRVGKERPTVANALRLLGLPESIRSALSAGTLTAGHARALLAVADDEQRNALFEQILQEELTVRQAESHAAELRQAKPTARHAGEHAFSPMHQAVAADLAARFQTDVRIIPRSGRRGRIVIEYDSLETLQRIAAKCLGLPSDSSALP